MRSIRFAAVALALLSAYAIVSETILFEQVVVEPHLEFVAQGTGLLLRALGERATVEGRVVRTDGFDFKTARGCDAIGAAALVCSLILAFPARARSRLIGAAVCTTILVVVNFLRTTNLAWIGTYHGGLYEFAHRDFWQTVFALLTVALFVAWTRISTARVLLRETAG